MFLFQRRLYASFAPERPQDIKNILKPLGLVNLPKSTTEIKKKTFKEKKADFLDLQKNRARREELKNEFFKSSFEHIYNFRHTGGKIFHSPKHMFNKESSLYMPNIRGIRIDDNTKMSVPLFQLLSKTKPNIIKLFSSVAGKKQIDNYTTGLSSNEVNMIEINSPTSWMNRFLVKLFSGKIRKATDSKYLIAEEKLTPEIVEALYAFNDLAGYLYLVDGNAKIRWATSGPPSDEEKQKFQKFLKQLE